MMKLMVAKDEQNLNEREAEYLARELKNVKVILTDGRRRIANIARIADVRVIKDPNDVILEASGMMTAKVQSGTLEESFYIEIGGVFFKPIFSIDSPYANLKVLESERMLNMLKFNYQYNIFSICFQKNGGFKRVRLSESGGTYKEWYSNERETNEVLSFYDGVLLGGEYIRVLPAIPPSVVTESLEEFFNQQNGNSPFQTIGEYKGFRTINGTVVPNLSKIHSFSIASFDGEDTSGQRYTVFSDESLCNDDIYSKA